MYKKEPWDMSYHRGSFSDVDPLLLSMAETKLYFHPPSMYEPFFA